MRLRSVYNKQHKQLVAEARAEKHSDKQWRQQGLGKRETKWRSSPAGHLSTRLVLQAIIPQAPAAGSSHELHEEAPHTVQPARPLGGGCQLGHAFCCAQACASMAARSSGCCCHVAASRLPQRRVRVTVVHLHNVRGAQHCGASRPSAAAGAGVHAKWPMHQGRICQVQQALPLQLWACRLAQPAQRSRPARSPHPAVFERVAERAGQRVAHAAAGGQVHVEVVAILLVGLLLGTQLGVLGLLQLGLGRLQGGCAGDQAAGGASRSGGGQAGGWAGAMGPLAILDTVV